MSSKLLKLLQSLKRFESNGRRDKSSKKRELEKRDDNDTRVRAVNQLWYSRDEKYTYTHVYM